MSPLYTPIADIDLRRCGQILLQKSPSRFCDIEN